jgi:hypothetical protein
MGIRANSRTAIKMKSFSIRSLIAGCPMQSHRDVFIQQVKDIFAR